MKKNDATPRFGSDHKPAGTDDQDGDRFYDYYARASQTPEALRRFRVVFDTVSAVWRNVRGEVSAFDVADIGCGAGTLSMMFAERGFRVHGLEINPSLLELARERAGAAGLVVDLRVGTASSLPWADRSMDLVLLPELLEHVPEWQQCLRECERVLRPGGLLYLTTTNKLCPVQQEFELPLYSWYPGFAKRFFERMAVSRWPSLVNHATYPAVNWFTYFGLRDELRRLGFDRFFDRFDILALRGDRSRSRYLLLAILVCPPLRWLGHVATPYTKIIALKQVNEAAPQSGRP